jgi:hypothetical protein
MGDGDQRATLPAVPATVGGHVLATNGGSRLIEGDGGLHGELLEGSAHREPMG